MSTIFSNALWLSRQQMRDLWPAYLITAAYFAFMGAVLAADESYTREFAHPILMLILIQPAISSRYMTLKQDNDVVRHQVFLRSTPMPLRTTIMARLLVMLIAGVINIPLYFGWFWSLGDHKFTVLQFVGWTVFWVSIALVGASLSLVQEFWLSMRRWTMLNTALVVVFAVTIPLLIWRTDFMPVEQSLSLSENHALIMAIVSLIVGIGSLVAGVLVAERLYRKREFVT